MDIVTYALNKAYTDEIGSGISNISNTGSSLIFTLTAGGTLTVPITGLSDQNFTLDLKNKLISLDDTVLNLFTYSSGTLYFNGNAIATASSVTSVANSLNTLNSEVTTHINSQNNPHNDKISNMADTSITSPTGSQILQYNSTTKKWINADPSASVKDEMVKLTASGDSEYLDALIDNSTIGIINDKLVAISLNGLSATTTELNTLTGMTENVKTKLDTLASAGMSYKGTVATKADLLALIGMASGNVRIVLSDESNSSKRITYIYDGSAWISLGEFNITVRDFTTNPINLTNEVTGTLEISHIDTSTLLKQTDVIDNVTSTDTNKPVSANQAKILQAEIDEKQKAIYVQNTMPTGTLILNDIWLNDTDSSNVIMYYYNGSTFIKVGKSGFTIDQFVGGISYTVNTYVTYNNMLYKCIVANNSTTFSTANFQLIGRDFTTNKIDLTSEVTGILPITNMDISTLVPTTRTINSKDLSSNIILTMSDIISYTDWTAYTPTITCPTTAFHLVNTYTMKGLYRIIGKNLQLKFVYTHPSNTGFNEGSGTLPYQISIPSGFTIDTSKANIPSNLVSTSQNGAGKDALPLGNGIYFSSTFPFCSSCKIVPLSSSVLGVYLPMNGTTVVNTLWGCSQSYYGGASVGLEFEANIPIL